jgi:hypothetical protein
MKNQLSPSCSIGSELFAESFSKYMKVSVAHSQTP